MGAEDAGFGVLRVEVFFDQVGPQKSGSPEFSNLHIKVHSHSEEERNSWGDLINTQAGFLRSADVFNTVSDSER